MEVKAVTTRSVVQHSAGYLTAQKRPQHELNLSTLMQLTPPDERSDVAIIMMND